MKRANPKVDFYFDKATKWSGELAKLRKITLSFPLAEELKWGVPCYTHVTHNVVLLHVFKEYCAILFVKGALLKDADKVLIQQTANVRAARQIRFTSMQDVTRLEPVVRAYIDEAIEVDKAGLKVVLKQESGPVPEELQNKFDAMPALKAAFDALTPGRRRGYLLHFSGAKQSKTRISRIDKCVPQILKGKGLDD